MASARNPSLITIRLNSQSNRLSVLTVSLTFSSQKTVQKKEKSSVNLRHQMSKDVIDFNLSFQEKHFHFSSGDEKVGNARVCVCVC